MQRAGRLVLGLVAALLVFMLLALFGVLTEPDPSVEKWSNEIVSGFRSIGTQLSALAIGVAVAVGGRLLGLIENRSNEQDPDNPTQPAPQVRPAKGGGLAVSGQEWDSWVRSKIARIKELEKNVEQLQAIRSAQDADRQQMIRIYESELRSKTKSRSRGELYRSLIVTSLWIAMWHLGSAVLEALWTVGAREVNWIAAISGWPPMNFLQTVLYATGACVIVAWQYLRYVRRTWDPSPGAALAIGVLGTGIPGFIAMLFTTQAVFQAISAPNWRPPYLDWPLFYYLLVVRLIALPLLGLLTATLVNVRIHGKVTRKTSHLKFV